MKKTISIFFLFLFLSSATEVRELYRLPLLIQHFLKHKEANESITLTAFLKLHYTAEKENDNDDREDNQLPFKAVPERIFPVFFTADYPQAEDPFPSFLTISHRSYYNLWIPSKSPDGVFHPPKIS